jgi:hypothetical protein
MAPVKLPLLPFHSTRTWLDLAYHVPSDLGPAVDMCTMIPILNFECRGFFNVTIDYSLPTDPDVYVCISGDTCGADACNFAFDDLFIIVDLPSYIDLCVETMEAITSFPTVAPGPSPSFNYSVRFEASWAIQYDSDASIATCTSTNPALIVVCENDARIDFVTAMTLR